jgi:hypothetical protein
MSGIYQKQVNSGSVAAPSAGRTLISVNESGELFTKDSSGNVIVYPTSSAGGGGGGATDSLSKSFTSTGNITIGDVVSVISDGTVQKSQFIDTSFVIDVPGPFTDLSSTGIIEVVKIADNKHIAAFYDTQSLTLHARSIEISGSSVITGSRLSIGNIYGGFPVTGNWKYFELTSHEPNKAVLSYYDTFLNQGSPTTASLMVISETDNALTTGSRALFTANYAQAEIQAVNDTQIISFGYDIDQMKYAANIIEVSGSDIISSNWGTFSYANSLGMNPPSYWDSTKYDTNKAAMTLTINNSKSDGGYDPYVLLVAASGSVVILSPDSITQMPSGLNDQFVSITNLSTDSLAFIQRVAFNYKQVMPGMYDLPGMVVQPVEQAIGTTNLIPISISSSVSASVPIDSIITGSNVSVNSNSGRPMLQGLNNVDGSGTNVVVLATSTNELISWVQSGNSFVSESSESKWALGSTANTDAIDISANNSGSIIVVGAFDTSSYDDFSAYRGDKLDWNGSDFASSAVNNLTSVVGIAQSTVGDGESVNVTIAGIAGNLSRLTPGGVYAVDKNGDVVDIDESESFGGILGTAISETELNLFILNGN